MECSDICVIAGNDATATLAIGDAAKPSPDAAVIENWREKVPRPDTASTAAAFWEGAPPKDNARGLIIEWKTNAAPADFYPYSNTNFEVEGMTETLPSPPGTIRLHKIVKKSEGDWPKQIDGILAGGVGSAERFGVEEHLTIQAPAAAPAPQAGAPVQTGSLLAMLLLAFRGRADFERDALRAARDRAEDFGLCQSVQGRSPARAAIGRGLWPGCVGFISGIGGAGHRGATRRRRGQLGGCFSQSPIPNHPHHFDDADRAESVRRL